MTVARRWLLFIHQLPAGSSNFRVRTWRRLQQIGALPLKQAVYVLPDSATARQDLESLKIEVTSSGGAAGVLAATSSDRSFDDTLIHEFRKSRQDAYAALARDIEKVLQRAGRIRRPRGARAPAVQRRRLIFRDRLAAIESLDFFGSAGRDRVVELLEQLQGSTTSSSARHRSPQGRGAPTTYHARLWVTRPRPGVDRMASAWLIRRFIDPDARFGFTADRQDVLDHALPFDMPGVEFSHQDGGCTFETLCAVFDIRDPAVARIAAIVHDIDLKDARFGAPEAPTVGAMIEGLQMAHTEDDALLGQGMTLFDSLYRSFAQENRVRRQPPVAPSTNRRPR